MNVHHIHIHIHKTIHSRMQPGETRFFALNALPFRNGILNMNRVTLTDEDGCVYKLTGTDWMPVHVNETFAHLLSSSTSSSLASPFPSFPPSCHTATLSSPTPLLPSPLSSPSSSLLIPPSSSSSSFSLSSSAPVLSPLPLHLY